MTRSERHPTPAGGSFVHTWDGLPNRSIVCIHALGGNHAHWSEIGPRLTRIGAVRAIDLAGFGRTPLAAGGASLEINRQLLADLLAEVGPSFLIGSSFGGGVALLQAATDPGSVRGLVLSGSMLPNAPGSLNTRSDLLRRRLQQRARDIRAGAAAFRDGRLRPNHRSIHGYLLRGNAERPDAVDPGLVEASVRAAAGRARLASLRAVLSAGASSFGLMTDPDRFSDLLTGVSCPVLVVHGGRDRTVPVAHARAAVRGRAGWELVVFDEIGHLPHVEAPNNWLDVVGPWLAARA